MSNEFREKLNVLTKTGECSVSHMYLDSVGKVTVGVGNMIPGGNDAILLPFVVSSSGEIADRVQIIAEFQLVVEQEEGHSAGYYNQFTSLELSDVVQLFLTTQLSNFL